MPISIDVVPSRDLLVVTYSGAAQSGETIEALEAYLRQPDVGPHFAHLVDTRGVTEVEKNFGRFFAMQARLAELPEADAQTDTLIVYIAPTAPGREMAELARRSWDGVPGTVIVAFETEAEALSFLGQPERSLSELFEVTGAGARNDAGSAV